MNDKSFLENISDETLAKMIDTTLNFEKSQKSDRTKTKWLKIIPVAAVFLLIVGVLNITHIFSLINIDDLNLMHHEETVAEAPDEILDNTVETQIGDLIIKTPKGQEPIEVNDMIVLPGGGTYERLSLSLQERVTVANGTVIKSDGIIPNIPANKGKKIIVQCDDGMLVVIDEYEEITIDGKTLEEYIEDYGNTVRERFENFEWGNWNDLWQNTDWYNERIEEYKNWIEERVEIFGERITENLFDWADIDWAKNLPERFGIEIPEIPEFPGFFGEFLDLPEMQEQLDGSWYGDIDWSGRFWEIHNEGNKNIHELNDGTKITMSNSNGISTSQNGKYGYIVFHGKCTIEFTNGVTVKAPSRTGIEFGNDTYTVVIGNGGATVTKKDGSTSTIPGGAIIDNNGNQTGYKWEGNVNDWAKEIYEKSGLEEITSSNNSKLGLIHFMNQKTIDEIALKESEKSGFKNILGMIYYMSTKAIDEAALKSHEKFGIDGILSAIYYMNEKTVDEIAVKESEKSGIKTISNAIYYMSEKAVSEAALKSYENFGMDGILRAIYYMNQKSIDQIAIKESAKTGLNGDVSRMIYYMSTKAVDEAALISYEKFGVDSIKVARFYMSQKVLDEIAKREKAK